ncbi:Spo0E family sporulation regulatory protein-aspartic acid phosphatase [Brotaphodocola sp.]|uniref:Spo0E family sporulation regulatory protein-aspartic acid phosphatase n=1 Tax=Brotaphodocola sp. TaxID=3073577 RepID=UPI003D7D000D
MRIPKEELILEIEKARNALNHSIESGEAYESVYQNSVDLDHLIEEYILAGF